MRTDQLKEFVMWLSGWQVEGEHLRQKEQLEQSLPVGRMLGVFGEL